jgi:acetyltransferase-like isoleucine patch superfamily enzyme
MKKILRSILSLFNKLFLLRFFKSARITQNKYFRTRLTLPKENLIDTNRCEFPNTSIVVKGKNNIIQGSNSVFDNSKILIEGTNNKLVLGENVCLTYAKIFIRGNNCSILIGSNTIFNGGRIVNEGADNTIQIGEDCLFSDQIEIWASDTHKIFDKEKNIINNAKPIFIGNKVWIGCRTTILKGTTIKNGSIIGMGTIVTNDVGENEISVGVPNRTVKTQISWEK